MTRAAGVERRTIPPAATGAILLAISLAVWQWVAVSGVLGHLTVARFTDVAKLFPEVVTSAEFRDDLSLTVYQIGVALLWAQAIGFVLGYLMWRFDLARRALQPNLIGFGSFPGIVLYPAFIGIFGITNVSVIIIGASAAVVPFALGFEAALLQVPPVMRKLAQVYDMGSFRRFTRIIGPSALPHYFPSFRVGIMICMLATIGAQFLASNAGVGYRINIAYQRFLLEDLYVYLSAIFLLTILMHVGLNALEHLLRKDMR